MKKLLSLALALTLCLALFAGCATEVVEEPTSAVTVISPLPETLDIENLDNCTVAVSLKEGDAYVDDSGKMQMKVTAYSYELYDMVDIAALAEGNVIVRQGEEITVDSIERLETGLVRINGGEEMGGLDLISHDSTVYYQTGMDDAKSYYELGEITIPVSTEFTYVDSSDLENEPVVYYPGDFLTEDAGIEYFFIPHNTSIVIENGHVIRMDRVYIP